MADFIYRLQRFRLSPSSWVIFLVLTSTALAIWALAKFNVLPVATLAAAVGGLVLGVVLDAVTSRSSQDSSLKRFRFEFAEHEYNNSLQSLAARYIGVVSEAAEWTRNSAMQKDYPREGERFLSEASELARKILEIDDVSVDEVTFVLDTQNHLAKFVLMRGETEEGIEGLLERMGRLSLVGTMRTDSSVPGLTKIIAEEF